MGDGLQEIRGTLEIPYYEKNTEAKRLSICLSSLRQDTWIRGDEQIEILHPSKLCDKIRWIDTSVMAVDLLPR